MAADLSTGAMAGIEGRNAIQPNMGAQRCEVPECNNWAVAFMRYCWEHLPPYFWEFLGFW
ncbi:hypothetical protein VTK26DRAFT_3854 [Humicola hyalothermophila]